MTSDLNISKVMVISHVMSSTLHGSFVNEMTERLKGKGSKG